MRPLLFIITLAFFSSQLMAQQKTEWRRYSPNDGTTMDAILSDLIRTQQIGNKENLKIFKQNTHNGIDHNYYQQTKKRPSH